MLLGHLYTVKTNLSTFTQIFFISSSVLKTCLYPGMKSIRVWTADRLSRTKGARKVFRPVLMCHQLITSASPRPRGPEGPPCPRHQGSFVPAGRGTSPKHPSLLSTGSDYSWLRGFGAGLFVRPRANSGVLGNAHLRESKPRAAGPNPRIPAAVLRTSQKRLPSTPTNR